MSEVLIILDGTVSRPAPLRALARRADAVICADGGARHALRLGLSRVYVIGDMDSIPPGVRGPSRGAAAGGSGGWTFITDQDEDRSDFEKALRMALKLGARAAWVAGAWGGRTDHQLVNLALCERYSEGLALTLVGPGEARLLGPGRHTLSCRRGELVTLLPATPRARLATRGLAYPLRCEVLARGSRGLSNRAAARRVTVRVHAGRVWMVRPEAD